MLCNCHLYATFETDIELRENPYNNIDWNSRKHLATTFEKLNEQNDDTLRLPNMLLERQAK